MPLTTLKLENVRAFERQSWEFGPRSVILGANGVGKSTIIEAIRILSVGKSFRTSRFDELIRFEAPYCRIIGERSETEGEASSSASLRVPAAKVEFFYGQPFADAAKERILTINSKPADWLGFIGQFPSVLFVPSDIDLVIGPPQLRRRYLDSILWQVDAEFRQNYLDFSRVLRERAALLFLLKIRRAGLDELQPWNELIQQLSAAIQTKRQQYIEYLQKQLKGQLVGGQKVAVEYQPNQAELAAVQNQEIQSSQNLYGAHRDELEILLGDRSARRFASRGQTRTIVVMLKTVESRFLAFKSGQAPLLLLDDMFSELDDENSRYLFDSFEPDYQVILTSIKTQPLIKDWQTIKL
ncbi:MAG TPA: DNA replication and repair protein RecF [Candidatus Saccharimonadales bacterium]|nr:DNA replication and repair protein RecF [Candidatus Saccharimonadales bacterium]